MTETRVTRIVEAHGREIGRIHAVKIDGKHHGSFFTQTKTVTPPIGKCMAYGINWRYM